MISNNQGKLKLLKLRTSQNDDLEFKNIDINPLIKDFMIREAFYMFDVDHSGDIDKKEFTKLLTTLGLELNDKRILELMKEMDKDGSGTIDFEEFSVMMGKFQFGKECPIQQHLENAFNDYDKDMDGLISIEDFRKVSEELDAIPVTKEESNLFINFCKYFGKEKGIPSLHDNGITKEEFMNLLISINFLIDSKKEKSMIHAFQNSYNNPKTDGDKNDTDMQLNLMSENINSVLLKKEDNKSEMYLNKESSVLY